jgi:hypothetical protein
MSERAAGEIREEIADERLGLGGDLDGLKAKLRVPFLITGVFAVGFLAIALFIGIKRIWKHF